LLLEDVDGCDENLAIPALERSVLMLVRSLFASSSHSCCNRLESFQSCTTSLLSEGIIMARHNLQSFEIAILRSALEDIEWYGAARSMDHLSRMFGKRVVDLAKMDAQELKREIEARLAASSIAESQIEQKNS